MSGNAYKDAGVDIEAGNETVERIKASVASTHTPEVLTGIGSFGALYDIGAITKGYNEPVLVQSIDGVGTKLIVAEKMHSYCGVGADIVNHCCDDILAMGAKPLTFLDYVANEKLDPSVMADFVGGMSDACREAGVALIGGETAEMPGVYLPGAHDIAGVITGVVERSKIITGENIAEGDVLLGLASSGLHTNGFSLARKVLFEKAGFTVETKLPELSASVGETLLAVHRNYVPQVFSLFDSGIEIKGIAHITGGGFVDNIPRVLPDTLDAVIKKGTWPVLPIFEVIQREGAVDEMEMYKVFNMGIGLVLVVSQDSIAKIKEILTGREEVYEIGNIEKGSGITRII
jgi:phosphoribosylformylglycinamidine cyclo-ligase